MAHQRNASTGGRPYLVLVIIIAALIVALLAVAVIAVPRIASGIASDRIRDVAADAIGGTAEATVRIGWTSPACFESFTLKDAAGTTVADLSVETELSLIDMLRFDGRAGAVRIEGGELTVTPGVARALGIGREEGTADATDQGGRPAGGATRRGGVDLSALRDLRASLEIKGLDLTVVDERGTVIDSTDVDATVALDRGSADLSVASSDPTIDISAHAEGFIGADGALAIREGTAEAGVSIALDRRRAERLARLFGADLPEVGTIPIERESASGDRVLVRLDAALEKGRLRVTSKGGPSSVPLVDPLLARMLPEDGRIAGLQSRPSVSLSVREFAIDLLPESGGIVDMSTGVLDAAATVSRAHLRLDASDSEGARTANVAPLEITLSSSDLSGEVQADMRTSVAVGGERTGKASATAVIRGPLEDSLAFDRDSLRTVELIAGVKDVPSSMLEPLRSVLRPVYPGGAPTTSELFGARVGSVNLNVSPEDGSVLSSAVFNLTIESERSHVRAELMTRDGTLFGQGETAIRVDSMNLRPLAAAFLPERLTLRGDGSGMVALQNVEIPLRDGVWPDLSGSSVSARLIVGEFGVLIDGDETPTRLKSLDTLVEIAPGKPAEVRADYRFERGGRVFDLFARSTVDSFDLPSDIREVSLGTFRSARATVKAKLTDAPVSLVDAFDPDMARAVRELGGETVTIALRPSASGDGRAHTLDVTTGGDRFAGRSTVALRGGELTVTDSQYTGRLTPRAFDFLHGHYADGALGPDATLASETSYTLTAGELSMDVPGVIVPDPSTLGDFSAQLVLDEEAVFRDVQRPDEPSTVSVGLRAGTPVLRYLHDANETLEREVNGRVTVFDPDAPERPTLATIKGRASLVSLADVEVNLEESDTESIDAWLGLGGELAPAVGPELRGRAQIGWERQLDGRSYYVSLGGERLQFRANLLETDEGVGLFREPITAQWTPTEAFLLSRLDLRDKATGEHRLDLAKLSPIGVAVDTFELGPPGARLEPGKVNIGAKVHMDRLAFSIDDGPMVEFKTIQATAEPNDALDAVDFRFVATRVGETGETASNESGDGALSADGTALIREDGTVAISMEASGDMPTLVVDAFARAGGAAYDLLGPTTTLDLRTNGLTRTSGSAMLDVLSDHAQGSIRGDVRGGVFHADDGARVTISRITEDFSSRYVETILPFLTRFEKTRTDEPSVFTADGLTIPLGDSIAELNGNVRVDLGTVQFRTSSLIGDILKATNNREQGRLGGRVEPFDVRIDGGVISYDRTPIPTGNYVMETRGTIDLVRSRMEVILYLPLSALSGDLRDAFAQVPGLDSVGKAPVRIKGPIDTPKVEPALDLIVEEGVPETIDRVLDGLLEKGLDDLLKE